MAVDFVTEKLFEACSNVQSEMLDGLPTITYDAIDTGSDDSFVFMVNFLEDGKSKLYRVYIAEIS